MKTPDELLAEMRRNQIGIGHSLACVQIADHIQQQVHETGRIDPYKLLDFLKALEPDYERVAPRS